MPMISPLSRLSPLGHRGGSVWTGLVSATVENSSPQDIVLTFSKALEWDENDFSVTIDGDSSDISSAIWAGAVLTITITDTIVFGDTVIVSLKTTPRTIINNTLADYYVRTDGSNTSPYDTPAKASSSIQTVMTYISNNGDNSGEVVSIGEGTFDTNIYFVGLKMDNVKVVGVSPELTIISPVGNKCLYQNTGGDNAIVKRLTLLPAADQRCYFGTNENKALTVKDVYFKGMPNQNEYMMMSQGNHLTLYNCRFYRQNSDLAIVYLSNAANANFYNCSVIAEGYSRSAGNGFIFTTTGTVNIDHCDFVDIGKVGLTFNAAGTFNIKNSIISGGCNYGSTYYSITRSAGTLTLTNNLIFSDIYDAERFINGTWVDGGGNIFTNLNPKFKSYPRKGFIIPRIDDYGNAAYAANVGTLLAARGFTGTFCSQTYAYAAGILPTWISMIQGGGMELSCHSYSHSDISLTGKIFDVTKAAETITIDRTADSITLSGGGTVSGFKSKTLAVIKTELEGLGATVTAAAIYGEAGVGHITASALGEVIAGGIATNQCDLLIDNTAATGLFKSEMADPKAFLTAVINSGGDITDPQTAATYECRTMIAAYGGASVDSRLAAIAAGFDAYASGDVLGYGVPHSVTKLDLYAIPGLGSEEFVGKAESVVRTAARLYGYLVAQTGLVILFVDHGTMSDEEWGWVLDEWEAFGSDIKVCSIQQYADEVRGGDWTDEGDGTFTRTYALGNYELEVDSPLIGQADDSGNIGAY